jgi:hypothetical protein
MVTDPPYGYSFMNKDWDKAVVSVETWKECLRVLKSGAFAFIMSSPRQDVLCKMILNLIDAGFETNFTSIYWTYASGFPKAANVSKLVDKRNGRNFDTSVKDYLNQKRKDKNLSFNQVNDYLGTATNGGGVASAIMGDKQFNELPTLETYNKLKVLLDLDNRFDELIEREEAEREIIGKDGRSAKESIFNIGIQKEWDITKSTTEAAKRLDGSYAGFQPKPALETILVVMKPLSEKSYVDQALNNSKGCTWLDDCRIPFQNNMDSDIDVMRSRKSSKGFTSGKEWTQGNNKGRFPANLIVSDDSLNDGKISKTSKSYRTDRPDITGGNFKTYKGSFETDTPRLSNYDDSGSYSRYFDLDKWFLQHEAQFIITPKASPSERQGSIHPTMKPLKLMSYLITMGSRPQDIILDPFCGSGTTCIAALQLGRQYIGIEIEKEYCEIAQKRLKPYQSQTKLLNF